MRSLPLQDVSSVMTDLNRELTVARSDNVVLIIDSLAPLIRCLTCPKLCHWLNEVVTGMNFVLLFS